MKAALPAVAVALLMFAGDARADWAQSSDVLVVRAYGCTGPATPDANCKLFLDEALRRGDEVAALDPNGLTSHAKQDQANRQIALSLARALDLLPTEIDSGRQATWRARIDARGEQIYADLSGPGDIDQYPYDSHRSTARLYLAAVSSLMVGTLPRADTWFTFGFRAYANVPSAWSGPAGGYANGTAYAEYTAASMVSQWDSIQAITGVNLYAKPWSVGFLDFMMQFTPPAQGVHAFGDASEQQPVQRVTLALASRMVSPRAAWYHGKLLGPSQFEDALTYLQAPYPLPVASTTLKTPPSNAVYFKSIGWTAMHSDIDSASRTSVFFKSSPYGSLSHSHGDQNGFLLSVGDKPFLMKAGAYVSYGSADWKTWYHQTRAQNAITLDGGQGQVVDGNRELLTHNGNITQFIVQAAYDFAEGDATVAYDSARGITLHKRQLWYLHNENAVLVRDKLASTLGHTYEFNLHAPADFVAEAGGVRRITSGGQAVCVVSGLTDAVFGAAPYGGVVPSPQFHGAFKVTRPAGTAEFLVLFDVGCKNLRPVVTTSSTGVRTVTVGTQSFVLN